MEKPEAEKKGSESGSGDGDGSVDRGSESDSPKKESDSGSGNNDGSDGTGSGGDIKSYSGLEGGSGGYRKALSGPEEGRVGAREGEVDGGSPMPIPSRNIPVQTWIGKVRPKPPISGSHAAGQLNGSGGGSSVAGRKLTKELKKNPNPKSK